MRFCIAYVTVDIVNGIKLLDSTTRVLGLAWGVHGPFRDYVQRMPDGHCQVADGATMLSSSEAFFPVDDDATTEGHLRFRGRLEFTGHRGMMAVVIEAPGLEQNPGGSSHLTIRDPFDPAQRMAFVAVELHNDHTGTTRLTESGTDVFMGNYTQHTDFDPVRLVLAEEDHQE